MPQETKMTIPITTGGQTQVRKHLWERPPEGQGYGLTRCQHCKRTTREIVVLGDPEHCHGEETSVVDLRHFDGPVQKPQPESIERMSHERLVEELVRRVVLSGLTEEPDVKAHHGLMQLKARTEILQRLSASVVTLIAQAGVRPDA